MKTVSDLQALTASDIDAAMKQYTFRMNLGYKPLDGTKITVKAESEDAARKQVVAIIKTATRDLKPESLEFLGTGRMTPSRMVKLDAQRLRQVWVGQIEREIADERTFLGMPKSEPNQEMSDADLLSALNS